MTTQIDLYFAEGCGRCPLGGTPHCKVHTWQEVLQHVRALPLACGLVEEVKWGVPCYTQQGKNIVTVSALKDCVVLGFFHGASLPDPDGLLVKQGANSQVGRIIRFTEARQVSRLKPKVISYIKAAMALAQNGQKPRASKPTERVPTELEEAFSKTAGLQKAFLALTPGRQRGYLLYFSAPKQSATRKARIEKCIQQIFEGKGMHDDYRAQQKR